MIWFTSDLHFWHKNIIQFCNRPWIDLESMHKGLIQTWNLLVKPDDEIWILGDFAFCGPGKIKQITSQLNGKKCLIRGNHDHEIKPHRNDLGFELIVDVHVMEIAGQRVCLSHYPFLNQEHDERKEFKIGARWEDHGQWLLHGHVHQSWTIKNRMINVGVDVWDYTPISINKIEEIIRGKK